MIMILVDKLCLRHWKTLIWWMYFSANDQGESQVLDIPWDLLSRGSRSFSARYSPAVHAHWLPSHLCSHPGTVTTASALATSTSASPTWHAMDCMVINKSNSFQPTSKDLLPLETLFSVSHPPPILRSCPVQNLFPTRDKGASSLSSR